MKLKESSKILLRRRGWLLGFWAFEEGNTMSKDICCSSSDGTTPKGRSRNSNQQDRLAPPYHYLFHVWRNFRPWPGYTVAPYIPKLLAG
jgi:hypothetical protein